MKNSEHEVQPEHKLSKVEFYRLMPNYIGKTAEQIQQETLLTNREVYTFVEDLGGIVEFSPQGVLKYGATVTEEEYFHLVPRDREIKSFVARIPKPVEGRTTLFMRRQNDPDEEIISEGKLVTRESNLGSQKFAHKVWEVMRDTFLATSEAEAEAIEKLKNDGKIKGESI
jgi:hypothetical protein